MKKKSHAASCMTWRRAASYTSIPPLDAPSDRVRFHPRAPAMDVLDLVMQGHEGTVIDFSDPTQPRGTWSSPTSDFGAILAHGKGRTLALDDLAYCRDAGGSLHAQPVLLGDALRPAPAAEDACAQQQLVVIRRGHPAHGRVAVDAARRQRLVALMNYRVA